MANVIPEIETASEHLHLLDALLHVANDARFGQTHTGNHHKRTTKANTIFFLGVSFVYFSLRTFRVFIIIYTIYSYAKSVEILDIN